MDAINSDSKVLRLARYLKEFAGLRTTIVTDLNRYEAVLWFGDIPQEPECDSPAWSDEFALGDPWLTVKKQQFPRPPVAPELLLPWIDEDALKRAGSEMPPLQPVRLVPDPQAVVSEGEDPPLVKTALADHPEVATAYDQFRPSWEAWSREYERRNRIQTVYAELFRFHTQLQKQGEIIELVLGLGLLEWRRPPGGKSVSILRHTVTAHVDLQFDAASGTMQLHAAAEGAQLCIEDDMLDPELRPERTHYASVGEQLAAIGDDIWDRPRIFTALKSWASALHAHSEWLPNLQRETSVGEKPCVTFAPALVLRRRTQAGMVRIYEAVIQRLSSGNEEAPAGWTALVADEDDLDAPAPHETTSEPGRPVTLGPEPIFFPLSANREQRRIVEAISQRRGVLVQGPPGTGKSHTIANLVCHLLATGKRVLITAETARALKVLKEKLPEDIQPLCVSLLGHGGDAFAELNAAVQGITTRFAAWSPGAYDRRIAEIDGELAAARRALAKIDTELRSLREEETYPHSIANGAYAGTALAIAKRVATQSGQFAWLRLPLDADDNPPISSADLTDWLRIRRTYGEDESTRAALRMVGTALLPSPAEFGLAVSLESESRDALDRVAQLRMHPAYTPIVGLVSERRAALRKALQALNEQRKELLRLGYEWLPGALADALEGRHARWQALLEESKEHIHIIDHLIGELGSSSVVIPEYRDLRAVRADAQAVIVHLGAGGRWTNFGIVTPRAVRDRRYLREQVTVDGQSADTADRLQIVCRHIDLILAFDAIELAWSDHGGLPNGAQLRIRSAAIAEHISALRTVLKYAANCRELARVLGATVPPVPEPDWRSDQIRLWLEIIDASGFEERYRLAAERTTACLRDLSTIVDLHDAHPVVPVLIQAVNKRDVRTYSEAYKEVQAVEQTRRDQETRAAVESVLGRKAPEFLQQLVGTLKDPVWDQRIKDWKDAWHWGIADNWLNKRADVTYRERLWRRRHQTEAAIGNLLAEGAALRAWSHFFQRLSHPEAAALKGWREAVRAMGKATGRSGRLERLRREARQYMDQCRDAIPVWIMPRYLVAEMIHPTPGRYDLVIVDEASQLGIESLFLFYIARKLIVVGDDQQISPYGIGISDEAVADLQHHYLQGIPHHNALSAQSSLYANAKIRFGQNIVLREHFRCMPEIIQFSNDLCYASNGTPLDPLRAYPANRLQPLVVRHVPEGYRTGSTQNALNEPEAEALVAQIVGCLRDARYAGRSMGVISLQGEAQARLIENKLLESVEPEVLEERRLICGDAYAFQGDERDIIFLSMVAAPGETRIGALSNDAARQRFNVAASRARDQLWLFHSATLEVLSPSCMRHHLLSYMLYPERQTTQDRAHHFDSQFERDVFGVISGRGFHVRTQVCVGDPVNHRYRIDLVVEGMQGRLAVECDGDQWHGPDRYEQDMARQRDLERAGWQFVRIRGGDFYRDPLNSMAPVWAELERLGIKPGGLDESAAEPPPPAERAAIRMPEVEEALPIWVAVSEVTEPTSSGGTTAPGEVRDRIPQEGPPIVEDSSAPPRAAEEARATTEVNDSAAHANDPNPTLPDYAAYRGAAGPHPRSAPAAVVADNLCRIIEVEGPMLAKRAYDIYLHGCRIRRLGGELKSALNKALAEVIKEGRVVSENEPGKSEIIFSTIRIKGSPAVNLRSRGPRSFEEIPWGELLAAATHAFDAATMAWGRDEHLHAILELFDLKRLTAQVRTRLQEILKRAESPAAMPSTSGTSKPSEGLFGFEEPNPTVH